MPRKSHRHHVRRSGRTVLAIAIGHALFASAAQPAKPLADNKVSINGRLNQTQSASGSEQPGVAAGLSIVVNSDRDNIADDGFCSLREALESANSDSSSGSTDGECEAGFEEDLITFDPLVFAPSSSTVITLTNGELQVYSTLEVRGPGAMVLTISGNGSGRVFSIDDGDASAELDVVIEGLTLTQGFADHGGAISNAEALTLRESMITQSSATNGGALHSVGSANVYSSTVYGNSASEQGGAVFISGSSVVVHSSTISGNTASELGGGIVSDSTVEIYSSTIVENSGGGFIQLSGDQVPETGLGISVFDRDNLSNSIFANNYGGPDCDSSTAFSSAILVKSGDCDASFDVDPVLGALQDNGGPTLTHALLVRSPVIDEGGNSRCEAFDQRGFERVVSGSGSTQARCDIGSFEFVDTFGPEPTLIRAPDLTSSWVARDRQGQAICVAFFDNTPLLDSNTIDPDDLSVSGPGGSLTGLWRRLFVLDTLQVEYEFAAPGGIWDGTANGTYTIALKANEVFDAALPTPNAAAPAELGTFEVSLPTPTDLTFVDSFESPDYREGGCRIDDRR